MQIGEEFKRSPEISFKLAQHFQGNSLVKSNFINASLKFIFFGKSKLIVSKNTIESRFCFNGIFTERSKESG